MDRVEDLWPAGLVGFLRESPSVERHPKVLWDEYRSGPLILGLSPSCASVVTAKRSRLARYHASAHKRLSLVPSNQIVAERCRVSPKSCNIGSEGYRDTGLGIGKRLLEFDSSGRFS